MAFSEDPSGRTKHRRMTLTYAGIARARLVIFTVAGAAKRPAMEAVYAGEDLPRGPGPGRAACCGWSTGTLPPVRG